MQNGSLVLLFAACFMLLICPAVAQQTTGIISGQVTDSSGAILPNVPVNLTGTASGITRVTKTTDQGSYSFQDVPIGTYQIDITAPSFQPFVTKNVQVTVASTTTVNAQLQVGGATQTVVVQESNIQVQTDSAALGSVISGTQVKELPLNGRNFVELTQLSPGVSAANGFVTQGKGLNGGVDMSVNGNPTTNNLFLIDGVNNNDTGSNRTILIYPSNEAIAEFKFLTNDYGAQYGQASGGIINIATRSGTNRFHGSLFYDGRNDALAAYDYFTAPNAGKGLPENGKAKLRRNDWGYSIGGPIKRDKLFFFWSQEWNDQIQGRQVSACVPTAAELSGDFSTPSCQSTAVPTFPSAIADPANPHKLAAVDPSAATVLQLLPPPSLSSLNSNGQNWSESIPTSLTWREENARVDYNITPKNSVFGRYTQDSWNNPAFNAGYWGDDPFPALDSSWAQPSKSIVGRWTSTISSSLVNSAAFQYSNNRIEITAGGTNPALLPQITAAIPTLYPESLKHSKLGVPPVNLGNYASGNTLQLQAPWQNQLDIYTAQDDLSWVKGRNTMRFGVSLGWSGKDEDTSGSSSERPTINTGDSSLAPGGIATGNNLANFEIPNNLFNITETSTNVRAQLRWRDYEGYASDNFRLTPRLTIDAGLRYSYSTPTYQPNGQATSFQPSLYDPAKPGSDACNGLWIVPGTDPCGDANAQFGTSFSKGVPGPNKYLQDVNNHLFAPRVGLAWDVYGNGKTAVRLGGGQFFQRERVSRYTLVSNAPFALTTTNYPRTLGGATPPSLSGSANPQGGFDPHDLIPNSWQWNATVEQSVGQSTVFSVSYVGNRGIHLTSTYDINQVPQQNWLAASFQNGNAINAYRPYSNYGTLTWWAHDGNSSYNGLQTLIRVHYTKLQLQAAYTWSHSISDIILDDSSGGLGVQTRTYYPDTRLDRGNGNTNRPNNFVANATYFLPLLSGANWMARGVLGGWQVSGITTAANGNNFTIYQGGAENSGALVPGGVSTLNSLVQTGFTNPLRPLLTGQSCTTGRQGNTIINPGAFTLVGYAIGTIPSNVEPRGFCGGPNFVNTDFAVDKNWKIREMATIQFRLDFFNLFNHPNFNPGSLSQGAPFQQVNCGAPDGSGLYQPCSETNNVVSTATSTSGFGTSSGLIGNSRQIQYELRINF